MKQQPSQDMQTAIGHMQEHNDAYPPAHTVGSTVEARRASGNSRYSGTTIQRDACFEIQIAYWTFAVDEPFVMVIAFC